jgi:hypothetical protein
MRHRLTDHLGAEMWVAEHEVGRNDAGPEAILLAVDVGKKRIEGSDPLSQAALQTGPLGFGQDPRNDVERDQPFGRLIVAVDRERDADAAEEQLGLAAPSVEQVGSPFG